MKKNNYRTGTKPTPNEGEVTAERFIDEMAEQYGTTREEVLRMMKEFNKNLDRIKDLNAKKDKIRRSVRNKLKKVI